LLAEPVTYHNSFVSDLPVDRTNVAEMAACGWKVENETFNTQHPRGADCTYTSP
jgi:hypothetical protein